MKSKTIKLIAIALFTVPLLAFAMPGFEAKGMTEDGAKALAAYMKGLKSGS